MTIAVAPVPGCELCRASVPPGCVPVAAGAAWRVLRVVDSPAFPAFYRLVWNAHVAEWSDLDEAQRVHCLQVLAGLEAHLRAAVQPRKVNLASLGNLVPHLHWHVVARFDWDTHFPQPIWGTAQRPLDEAAAGRVRALLPALDAQLAAVLGRPAS